MPDGIFETASQIEKLGIQPTSSIIKLNNLNDIFDKSYLEIYLC